MGMLWQRRGMHMSWLILHILYGTVDVESSLPVDLTPEEKGKGNNETFLEN